MLRVTGRCRFEIPGWFFDRDFPGPYLRRLKNVADSRPLPFEGASAVGAWTMGPPPDYRPSTI